MNLVIVSNRLPYAVARDEKGEWRVERGTGGLVTALRPILRDGNVYHILPQPDGWHWDGLEYYSPQAGQGVVFVFRPDSPDADQVVFLKGLEPGAAYRVSFEDSAETLVRQGRSLMDEGLRVNLAARYTSALVYLNRN